MPIATETKNILLIILWGSIGWSLEIVVEYFFETICPAFCSVYFFSSVSIMLYSLHKLLYPSYIKKYWKHTQANILTSCTKLYKQLGAYAKAHPKYIPNVWYQYTMNEKAYTSNQLHFDTESLLSENKNIQDIFKNDISTFVYVHPDKSTLSYMIVKLSKKQFLKYTILLVLSLIMSIVGFFIFAL